MIANLLLPGERIVWELGPLFPAATTTVIPAFTASSTALTRGSDPIGLLAGVPIERFSILVLYLSFVLITQSIADAIQRKK